MPRIGPAIGRSTQDAANLNTPQERVHELPFGSHDIVGQRYPKCNEIAVEAANRIPILGALEPCPIRVSLANGPWATPAKHGDR